VLVLHLRCDEGNEVPSRFGQVFGAKKQAAGSVSACPPRLDAATPTARIHRARFYLGGTRDGGGCGLCATSRRHRQEDSEL